MVRLKINYAIDMSLAVLLALSFFTGILKWPGFIQWFGLAPRDIQMGTLSTIHDWTGLLMGAVIFVHLILHFRWIICMTKKMLRGDNKCDS